MYVCILEVSHYYRYVFIVPCSCSHSLCYVICMFICYNGGATAVAIVPCYHVWLLINYAACLFLLLQVTTGPLIPAIPPTRCLFYFLLPATCSANSMVLHNPHTCLLLDTCARRHFLRAGTTFTLIFLFVLHYGTYDLHIPIHSTVAPCLPPTRSCRPSRCDLCTT